jgi:aspartyl-tRNA(Asn)/glutamyl-tRNA(Gln) amidotransferase subunit C
MQPVALSHEEVRHIAELAKLELTDDEIVLYAGQLSHILDSFQKLQELDTSAIEPTASVLPLKNVLRPDRAEAPLTPEQVIVNAPDSSQNQFRVRAVLEDV